jgi:hypothetical protein
VDFAPILWDFGKHVVVAAPHQFLVAKTVVVPETPARSQVSHLDVEHRDRYRCELREAAQIFFACSHRFFGPPACRDIQDDADKARRVAFTLP